MRCARPRTRTPASARYLRPACLRPSRTRSFFISVMNEGPTRSPVAAPLCPAGPGRCRVDPTRNQGCGPGPVVRFHVAAASALLLRTLERHGRAAVWCAVAEPLSGVQRPGRAAVWCAVTGPGRCLVCSDRAGPLSSPSRPQAEPEPLARLRVRRLARIQSGRYGLPDWGLLSPCARWSLGATRTRGATFATRLGPHGCRLGALRGLPRDPATRPCQPVQAGPVKATRYGGDTACGEQQPLPTASRFGGDSAFCTTQQVHALAGRRRRSI